MVRVQPFPVLAAAQALHAVIEVVERDREVAWVPTGGLETEPCPAEHADPNQRQYGEPDQWGLLGKFVNGRVPGGEDRQTERPVDRVVSLGVAAQPEGVQLAAAHNDDVVVFEYVTGSEVSQLRHGPTSG